MKLLLALLIIIAVSVNAEEACIFDETAYLEFINEYSAHNRNAKILSDGKTLIVNRNDEEISVRGGGCIHLGVSIESSKKRTFTEGQFLQTTLDLSIEFGSWLINTKALESAIEAGTYRKVDGTYFIEVDAMTVFNASHDSQGKLKIDFYIN